MPRRAQVTDVSVAVAAISDRLKVFQDDYEKLPLRSRVSRVVEVRHGTEDLGVSVMHHSVECGQSAKDRIRQYMVVHVGEIIQGDELAVVGGISEYGRRIRELRVEEGYRIFSGASTDESSGLNLQPDQYLLTDVDPDSDSARRWHIANRIRRQSGGARLRILDYLRENLLRVVTTEEIRYVAKSAEFGRRIRELRSEEGYAIATHYTGRPDLRPGEYVLLDSERIAEPHDRHIPVDVQREVFARDRNLCRSCAWDPSMWTQADPRILELHHVEHHIERGSNLTRNLLLLCSRCHDDLHAGRIELPGGAL